MVAVIATPECVLVLNRHWRGIGQHLHDLQARERWRTIGVCYRAVVALSARRPKLVVLPDRGQQAIVTGVDQPGASQLCRVGRDRRGASGSVGLGDGDRVVAGGTGDGAEADGRTRAVLVGRIRLTTL